MLVKWWKYDSNCELKKDDFLDEDQKKVGSIIELSSHPPPLSPA